MANSENYDSYTVLEMFQLLTILKKGPIPWVRLGEELRGVRGGYSSPRGPGTERIKL